MKGTAVILDETIAVYAYGLVLLKIQIVLIVVPAQLFVSDFYCCLLSLH